MFAGAILRDGVGLGSGWIEWRSGWIEWRSGWVRVVLEKRRKWM
jgi:hypothetical protein